MPDRFDPIAPSYLIAECRAASHELRAVQLRLKAMAARLPESFEALRGVVEVACCDHVCRAANSLEAVEQMRSER